jgi:hypothetical protein
VVKQYRYILSGLVSPEDKVSRFRLIAGNMIKSEYVGATAVRIPVPDDMVLEKWRGDCYSTTDDTRTIEQLGFDMLVWTGKRWLVRNELKGYQPHEITMPLLVEKGVLKAGRRWQ